MVIWFVIGEFRDLIEIVRTLRTLQRDVTDDGTVSEKERVQLAVTDRDER